MRFGGRGSVCGGGGVVRGGGIRFGGGTWEVGLVKEGTRFGSIVCALTGSVIALLVNTEKPSRNQSWRFR